MSVICISYITLDGILTDPAGSEGTAHGGWMLRYGREPIDGDKFKIGQLLEDGALLFGRGTWQAFAQLWPHRDTVFAQRMNAAAKLVATRTLTDVSAWANSTVLDGDVLEAVKNERRDVLVMGSAEIVHQLAAADLIDEYRLMTVPTVLGSGVRLFPDSSRYAELEVVDTEANGPFVFTHCRRCYNEPKMLVS